MQFYLIDHAAEGVFTQARPVADGDERPLPDNQTGAYIDFAYLIVAEKAIQTLTAIYLPKRHAILRLTIHAVVGQNRECGVKAWHMHYDAIYPVFLWRMGI